MKKTAQWKNRTFEDYGSTNSPDYIKFQSQYRRDLGKLARSHEWELASFNKNHYCFSAFLHNPANDKYAYLSISDVRDFHDDWADDILIRSAESEEDFTGGPNHSATLDTLGEELSRLLD